MLLVVERAPTHGGWIQISPLTHSPGPSLAGRNKRAGGFGGAPGPHLGAETWTTKIKTNIDPPGNWGLTRFTCTSSMEWRLVTLRGFSLATSDRSSIGSEITRRKFGRVMSTERREKVLFHRPRRD